MAVHNTSSSQEDLRGRHDNDHHDDDLTMTSSRNSHNNGGTIIPRKYNVSPNKAAATTTVATTTSSAEEHHHQQQDEDDDDVLFICRCDTPKLFVELLQAFSKTGLSSLLSRPTTTQRASAAGTTNTQSQRRHNTSTSSSSMMPQQPMTIFCNAQAMTIHSQSSNKQFQASMELPSSFFQHYQLIPQHDDDDHGAAGGEMVTYDFTIHWQKFLQCLSVLLTTTMSSGTSTAPLSGSTPQSSLLTMAYHTFTEVLRLEWESLVLSSGGEREGRYGTNRTTSSIMATAALPGLETPESQEAAELSTAFQESPIQGRWLSSSHILKEAKNELELVPGATVVQVQFLEDRAPSETTTTATMVPNKKKTIEVGRPQPCLRLVTKGYASQVVVEIPGSIEFSQSNNENDNDVDDDDNSNSERAWDYPSQPTLRRRPRKLTHTYPLAHWRQALQPLDMAMETCISVNREGIMAIQHSIQVEKGHNATSKSSDHGQDTTPTLVFCDFLILPMVEQLEDDDEEDDDDDDDDDERTAEVNINEDDDDDDSMMESSGWKTQSSHDGDHPEQDQMIKDTQSQTLRHPSIQQQARRRGGRSTNGQHGGHDGEHNREASLPNGSDEEGEGNDDDDEDRALPPKRSGRLFPSLCGAIQDTPRSTMTQETTESVAAVMRQRRRRDHRKRQRRWSNEQQEPQSQIRPMKFSGCKDSPKHANVEDGDDDDDDDGKSVNLLEDSLLSFSRDHASKRQEQNQKQRTRYYSSEEDKNDEDHYCSSPEIVYGES
jgi:hypothetical protein